MLLIPLTLGHAFIVVFILSSVHMSHARHVQTQKQIRVLENRLDKVNRTIISNYNIHKLYMCLHAEIGYNLHSMAMKFCALKDSTVQKKNYFTTINPYQSSLMRGFLHIHYHCNHDNMQHQRGSKDLGSGGWGWVVDKRQS